MLKKINIIDLFLVLAIIAAVLLYNFAQRKFQTRVVDSINVELTSVNNHFITQKMVENLLKHNFPSTSKVLVEDLDLNKLESELLKNEMIEDAEVYLSVDGVLHAVVKQKTALARMLKNNSSYYLDTKGNAMPLSKEFSAHVPVVSGKVPKKKTEEFLYLLTKIKEDEFLKNSIYGINILPDNSVKLFVREYNYDIEFGHLNEIDKKIQNYKAFVHYAQQDTLISHYTNINLRFTQQVICTK